jgi:hypothetical protein
MVPEKWRASGRVRADAVEEVRRILIQVVVDHDCFVLSVFSWVAGLYAFAEVGAFVKLMRNVDGDDKLSSLLTRMAR